MSVKNSSVPPSEALSHSMCEAALHAAVEKAEHIGVKVSIALLDAGGHLLRFVRMSEIHVGTVEVSMAKARCAVLFKRSTKTFAESYATGATALTALPGVVPFEGGVPIIINGVLWGAVGCSGASPEQDGAIAEAIVNRILGD
jgi:glc operon protein GlcG